jgi:inositol phosphorylceramide mannosyltransferase catalytic subunit
MLKVAQNWINSRCQMRKRVLEDLNCSKSPVLPISEAESRLWCAFHLRRYLLSYRSRILQYVITITALYFISCIVYQAGYLTREAIMFGDPCKSAEEIREKFSNSPRMKLKNSLLSVPKIIHQQWKTEDIPMGLFKNVNAEWRSLFSEPEYQHMLWTDKKMRALIDERFPWFLSVYDSYPTNIQRADASRYFILYAYGGLYADLDYEPLVNFWRDIPPDRVSLIESPYMFNEQVQNSLMASPKGDPFWNITFDLLQERHKSEDILYSTGPVLVDESIRRAPHMSWVHILSCKNFQRIPLETAEQGRSFEARLIQRLKRYSTQVRTCGNPLRRDDCQFGIHHNAVTYNSDLKKSK